MNGFCDITHDILIHQKIYQFRTAKAISLDFKITLMITT